MKQQSRTMVARSRKKTHSFEGDNRTVSAPLLFELQPEFCFSLVAAAAAAASAAAAGLGGSKRVERKSTFYLPGVNNRTTGPQSRDSKSEGKCNTLHSGRRAAAACCSLFHLSCSCNAAASKGNLLCEQVGGGCLKLADAGQAFGGRMRLCCSPLELQLRSVSSLCPRPSPRLCSLQASESLG